jgi:hypothetical protein
MVLAANAPARAPAAIATARIQAAPRNTPATSAVSRPSRSPATIPADDDGLGALYDLAQQANSAAPPPAAVRCPQCASALDDGAVLCTNCGFDTRTGKNLARAAAAAPAPSTLPYATPKKPSKPVDYMAPQGSLVVGTAVSAAFALAASIVWILFAWFTGLAIGYIAILIGVAAGLGMRIGQKGFSGAGGFAASALTLFAILLAKFIVLRLLLDEKAPDKSIFNLDPAKLAYYFFNPIGLIIIAVGLLAAYRTANGSVKG